MRTIIFTITKRIKKNGSVVYSITTDSDKAKELQSSSDNNIMPGYWLIERIAGITHLCELNYKSAALFEYDFRKENK